MKMCNDCKKFLPLEGRGTSIHLHIGACLKGDAEYKKIVWANCDACEEFDAKVSNNETRGK